MKKSMMVLAIALAIVSCGGGAPGLITKSPVAGARPVGLGNAYAGLADDASAVFLNPAGLRQISSLQLMNYYASPFPNNSIITLAGVLPKQQGVTPAFAYINNTTSGIPLEVPNTAEVSFTEQEFVLGFGGALAENIALGLNLDIMTKTFSVASPLLAGNRGSGMNMDLGLLVDLRPDLKAGVDLQNFLPAAWGGKFNYDNGVSQAIPANLRLGLSWLPRAGINLLLDLDKSFQQEQPMLWHLGAEWRPVDLVALRGGIDQTPSSQSQAYNNLTLGLGLKARDIIFDYAYYRSGDPTGRTTNYFTLSYAPLIKAPVIMPEAVPVVPPSELLPPRTPRIKFKDVPENHPNREAIELTATAGLISGYPDGTFRPDKPVTRQEFEDLMAAARHVKPAKMTDPSELVSTRGGVAKMIYDSPAGQTAVRRLGKGI